jgi:integrase
MFRWAAENEVIPVAVHQALTTVTGLRQGRTEAREKPPIGPVSDADVESTLPHVSPTVAAMIRLQRLTGMRPQEVILLRAIDIDMTDPACWVYRPSRHKTEHRGRERVIYLGPKSQAILKPFLSLQVTGYLFSPRRAVEQYRAERKAQRKSPLTPSQAKRRPKTIPMRAPGELYDDGAYRKAIRRGCEKAGIPIWFPNQLRHTAATQIRARYGLEGSQAVLGHKELGVTQVYAEVDQSRARTIMAEIG